jgi:hypothetical protein
MLNRRGFVAGLLGLPVAGKVLKDLPKEEIKKEEVSQAEAGECVKVGGECPKESWPTGINQCIECNYVTLNNDKGNITASGSGTFYYNDSTSIIFGKGNDWNINPNACSG